MNGDVGLSGHGRAGAGDVTGGFVDIERVISEKGEAAEQGGNDRESENCTKYFHDFMVA